MGFNFREAAREFTFQHEEHDTGGTKFPRRVDTTVHHPETGEPVGSARYFPPKRRGGPIHIDDVQAHTPGAGSAVLNEIESRHPGSTMKFLHEVKRNNNNPDKTGHAHERAGAASDWDTHYPNLAPTVHRGFSLRLPPYAARTVNSSSSTVDEHLKALHSEITSSLGMHWTENEHAARQFAHNAVSDHRTDIPVVLHATTPERKDIETRKDHLYRGGVFAYGDEHSPENEIPIRKGRTVNVTGISWRPDAAHPDADEHGWVHHTYPEPMHHTAAVVKEEEDALGTGGRDRDMDPSAGPEEPASVAGDETPAACSYCGSTEFKDLTDNGRVRQATCAACGGTMSAHDGAQWTPELIGDPSNHPKPDADPRSGGVGGAAAVGMDPLVRDMSRLSVMHFAAPEDDEHVRGMGLPPLHPDDTHAERTAKLAQHYDHLGQSYERNDAYSDGEHPLFQHHKDHGVPHFNWRTLADVDPHAKAVVASHLSRENQRAGAGHWLGWPSVNIEHPGHGSELDERTFAHYGRGDITVRHDLAHDPEEGGAPDQEWFSSSHAPSTLSHVLTHEHGHFLQSRQLDEDENGNRRAAMLHEVSKHIPGASVFHGKGTGGEPENWVHQNREHIINHVGTYAASDDHELVSELYTEHRHSPNPSMAARTVGRHLDGGQQHDHGDSHLGEVGATTARTAGQGADTRGTGGHYQGAAAAELAGRGRLAGLTKLLPEHEDPEEHLTTPTRRVGFAGYVESEPTNFGNHGDNPDWADEQAVGAHAGVHEFRGYSGRENDFEHWHTKGEIGPVPLHGAKVYATQARVTNHGVNLYLKHPEHKPGSGHPDYPANDRPIFVKHEGNYYTLDGHHRTAAAMIRGDKHIEGHVFDADKHGFPKPEWSPGQYKHLPKELTKYSALAGAYLGCGFDTDDEAEALQHELDHHDDGFCSAPKHSKVHIGKITDPEMHEVLTRFGHNHQTGQQHPHREHTLTPVKHAGFKGYVEGYEGQHEDNMQEDREAYGSRHPEGGFDEDLWEHTAPEMNTHEREHYEEWGEHPDQEDYDDRHAVAYEKAKQEKEDAVKPVAHHGGVFNMLANEMERDYPSWHKKGEIRRVDVGKHDVYATQPHVVDRHVNRYLQNPGDTVAHVKEHGMNLAQEQYPGTHHPMMVKHEGNLFTVEGHHRVASALLRKEPVEAMVYDADKHGFPHYDDDEDYGEGYEKHEGLQKHALLMGADCNFDIEDPREAHQHAIRHHDDGVCTLTEAARHRESQRNPKEAAVDGPDWCTWRRAAQCTFPNDRNNTLLAIPQVRGACPWTTRYEQQICPISEPGPQALMSVKGSYRYRQTVQTANGYEDESREIEGPLYHGGRAKVGPGDHLTVGQKPNSWGDEGPKSTHNYFSTDRDTALSYTRDLGSKGRLYEVEPTGEFKKDYGPYDYKTPHPLRVVREVPREEWPGWVNTKQASKALSWDEIGDRHPHVYGDSEIHGDAADGADGPGIGDAANYLAHERPGHLDAEDTSVHDLAFREETVHPRHIDYAPSGVNDPRVMRAREGYRQHPGEMPPLVLVKRHNVYQVADGHHRAEAAHGLKMPVRAYVADSPYPDTPFHDGDKAPFHGAKPIPKERAPRAPKPKPYDPDQLKLFGSSDEDTSYRMQHQAPDADYGAPLHDVEEMMPGFYEHPEHYHFGQEDFHTSANVIRGARGNPDKKVRVYRSLPAEHAHKGIQTGDWVTTSKEHARLHGKHHEDSKHDWPVISTMVPAKHLHTEGDVHEWGYNGPPKVGMVAFKGGYHQEVRQGDEGVVPVKRRPKKEASVEALSVPQSYELARVARQNPEMAFHVTAAWSDVRNKAKRIRSEGKVMIKVATNEGLAGMVEGDHGMYENMIAYRPGTRKIADWSCNCEWGDWAWKRIRFHGRQCSHSLALQYEAQSRGMFGREIKLGALSFGQELPLDELSGISDKPISLIARTMVESDEDPADIMKLLMAYGLPHSAALSLIKRADWWDDDDDSEECEYCGHDKNAEDHGEVHHDWRTQQKWHTDWDEVEGLGGEHNELHRGMALSLPDHVHDVVHDESRPKHERAQALVDHILKGNEGHLGRFWSDEQGVSRNYATGTLVHPSEVQNSRGRKTPVLIHAHMPSRAHIETDPDELEHHGVYSYHEAGNREVPLQHGTPLHLKGVSWHGDMADHQSKYSPHPNHFGEYPDKGTDDHLWTRHDFDGKGIKATSSLQALAEEEEHRRKCPFCGGGLSEKALEEHKCPHCGHPIGHVAAVHEGAIADLSVPAFAAWHTVNHLPEAHPDGSDYIHPDVVQRLYNHHNIVLHPESEGFPEEKSPGNPEHVWPTEPLHTTQNWLTKSSLQHHIENPDSRTWIVEHNGQKWIGEGHHRQLAQRMVFSHEARNPFIAVSEEDERRKKHHHTHDTRRHAPYFGYGVPGWIGLPLGWCPQCTGSGCGHCGGTGQVALDGNGHTANPVPDQNGDEGQMMSGGISDTSSLRTAKDSGPTVSGVALKAADTGRVLMLQRALGEDHPAAGRWELPGGHHEPGDTTSLHAGIREWQEEVGQKFPEGGTVHHTWTSPDGVYQGHVVVIPSEKDLSMKDGRVIPNPDDPKGDEHEQAAWWDIDHARDNPAVRDEVREHTPWDEIASAGTTEKTASAWDPLTGEGDTPGFPYAAPQHSNSKNPGSTGFATSEDPRSWTSASEIPDHLLPSSSYDSMGYYGTLRSESEWYHGSPHHIPVGSYVEPGHEPNYDASESHKVYLTNDLEDARAWGQSAHEMHGNDTDPVYVHEVEPEGEPQHRYFDEADEWSTPRARVKRVHKFRNEMREGSLHDHPEPALPSTDGADDEEKPLGWIPPGSGYQPPETHGSISDIDGSTVPNQFTGSANVNDIVMQFQATAGAKSIMANTPANTPGGGDVSFDFAAAARQYLAQDKGLQKSALKDFNFVEQQELINEGKAEDARARNFGSLQIEGTHYEALSQALGLADEDAEEIFN